MAPSYIGSRSESSRPSSEVGLKELMPGRLCVRDYRETLLRWALQLCMHFGQVGPCDVHDALVANGGRVRT